MLLTDLFAEYVAENAAIRSKRTQSLYLIAINHFSDSLGHGATVADFNERAMKAFLMFRQDQVADSTYENEAVKIMALWRWAATRHYCEAPRIKIVRQAPPTPKALLQDQIRALFLAAAAYQRTVGGVDGGILFPALLGIIWDTAERIGAVHALRRADIDLARREVTFRTRKGRGRVLRKSISKATASAIELLLEAHAADSPFAPVRLNSLYHHLDQITEAAGMPIEKGQKFHALRKSHASYLVAAGGDARASLDHSSDSVTLKHYIDPTVAQTRQPVDLLFSPFSASQRFTFWLRRVRMSFGL